VSITVKTLQRRGFAVQDGLDVDNRRTVDCFYSLHENKPVSVYSKNFGPVQADGVGPVRGASRKYSGQSSISTGIHFER
jgi:hypothetical protein